MCLSPTTYSQAAFGVNPFFVPQSTLFDATQDAAAWYGEFGENPYGFPFGFVWPTQLPPAAAPPPPPAAARRNTSSAAAAAAAWLHLAEGHAGVEPWSSAPSSEPHDFDFPVFLSTSSNQEWAATMLAYLEQGFYIDYYTNLVQVRFTTFNAVSGLFALVTVTFQVGSGGLISASSEVRSENVQPYSSAADRPRLVLEIVFAVFALCSCFVELNRHRAMWAATGSFWTYPKTSALEFATGWLLFLVIAMWITFAKKLAPQFGVEPTFSVYAAPPLGAAVSPDLIHVPDGGAGMAAVVSMFRRVALLFDYISVYYTINGVNAILMVARLIKYAHFQPRLGVLTHAFVACATDLAHFFAVLLTVYSVYSATGYFLFGPYLADFATPSQAFLSCFTMISWGDDGPIYALLSLRGVIAVPAALYVLSYTLLVVMILTNFLLAIILDSFSTVKDSIREEKVPSVPREVFDLLFGWWSSAMGDRTVTAAGFRDAFLHPFTRPAGDMFWERDAERTVHAALLARAEREEQEAGAPQGGEEEAGEAKPRRLSQGNARDDLPGLMAQIGEEQVRAKAAAPRAIRYP